MKLFVRPSIANPLNRWIAMAALGACLLALESCGIPKLRGPEPTRPLPETFTGEEPADNSAYLAIDEFFVDPNLTGLIYNSLAGNQELKILNEQIQIANNEVLRRRGAYLPFVTIGGRALAEKPSFNTPIGAAEDQLFPANGGAGGFPNPLPDFMVAANLSWQIDIWRQLRNARDAAGLRYLGTIDGRNYIITRLVAEIAENYYTLMALDQRLMILDSIISLQERSLELAKARKAAARDTELAVQRFQAEVRKNQSEKLIINQEIIEVENRINFLCGRFPQPVFRTTTNFIDLALHSLSLGVPAQLLQNRPDIRQAERNLEAAGLDIAVARANFYPKLNIYAGVGYEAFNAKYLLVTPASLIYNVAGDLIAPLINKKAIRADYLNANAQQLHNYSNSIELKKQQVTALETSVDVASNLFQNARLEYIDILFAQRDLLDARRVLIDTKREQLSAIVNTYQALGGGLTLIDYVQWSVNPEMLMLAPDAQGAGMPFCPPGTPGAFLPGAMPQQGGDIPATPPAAPVEPTPAPAPAPVPDAPALVPPTPNQAEEKK
jgi:outer membrane protein TolC